MLVAVGWSVLLALGWVVINGDAMVAIDLFGRAKVNPSKRFARRAIIESQVKKTPILDCNHRGKLMPSPLCCNLLSGISFFDSIAFRLRQIECQSSLLV